MAGLKERTGTSAPPDFPRPKIFSDQEQEMVRTNLLRMLANCPNPETRQQYTYEELAKIFGFNLRTVRRRLNEPPDINKTRPEVNHEPIPQNERSFYLGIAVGTSAASQLKWGTSRFVVVSTEGNRKRELLKRTVGTRGKIHDNSDELRIYLAYPEFNFMVNPKVVCRDLESKTRFAPFLLGLMLSRLSDQQDRLSLNNDSLLGRVNRYFKSHFGFNIGNFNLEKRGNNGYREVLPVIDVKNPGKVFGALIGVDSVKSLPFLPELARLSLAPDSGTS